MILHLMMRMLASMVFLVMRMLVRDGELCRLHRHLCLRLITIMLVRSTARASITSAVTVAAIIRGCVAVGSIRSLCVHIPQL